MKNRRGFTLIEMLGCIALMALLGVICVTVSVKIIKRARAATIAQQTVTLQGALNTWVAQQSSLASAAKRFSGDESVLAPKTEELEAILAEACSTLSEDGDRFFLDPENPTHIVSDALSAGGAYIWITWPQPYRETHLKANLYQPE